MRLHDGEPKIKKSIVLKVVPYLSSLSDDSDCDENEEYEINMITRYVGKFIRRNMIRDSRNYNRASSKRERSKKVKIICYRCKKAGNMKSECPELNKKYKNEKERGKKKTMVTVWSDEDLSSSSDRVMQ